MAERITWTTPIAAVAGKDANKVTEALGVTQIGQLLSTYPRHWVSKGSLSDLGKLSEGDYLTMFGEIVVSKVLPYQDRRTGRTAYRLEMRVKGEDGALRMTWFDRDRNTSQWRARKMCIGNFGLFAGKLKWFNGEWELTNPRAKMFAAEGEASEAHLAIPDLIAIYKTSGRVDSWQIADAITLALELVDDVPDVLPPALRERLGLLDAGTALRWIHAPDDQRQLGAAKKRLKYDEAFVAQVVLAQRRRLMASQPAAPRTGGGNLLARFDSQLPFQLTTGQQVVGAQIEADLAREHPMHRLLQGEVGSGKTLVALRAMLRVVDSGAQSVLLAPTEVLAQQHHQSITGLLGGLARGGLLGGDPEGTRVALLTGSMGTPARRQTLADVASGEAGIVVGTHALLEDKVSFADLGLVVVDEQHRFGVEQRAALTAKSAQPPHVLVMTATPIPRTVAMTVFGDLDTSVLKELPAGRAEVQTSVVPTQAQPTWLDRAWERVGEEVARGRQAYVVCPRIGDEPPPEEGPELHSVEELADALAAGPLSHLRVGRLHGRMASEDKDATMSAFAAGEIDVLVSTTVIEVGVDVSNASIMVVMDAERFGVSQLHQLRGRIGRGQHPGLCLLVTGIEPTSPSMERLLAVAATRDGFALAEVDLKARREGDVLGTDQSGTRRQLQLLSVISPRDVEVIEEAREIATEFVAADPTLASWPPLADAVRKLEDRADYLEMG